MYCGDGDDFAAFEGKITTRTDDFELVTRREGALPPSGSLSSSPVEKKTEATGDQEHSKEAEATVLAVKDDERAKKKRKTESVRTPVSEVIVGDCRFATTCFPSFRLVPTDSSPRLQLCHFRLFPLLPLQRRAQGLAPC